MARKKAERPPGVGNPFEEEVVTNASHIEITAPVRVERPPVLRLVSGPGAPQSYMCVLDRIVVGRSRDAEIRIDGRDISRKHLLIERIGEEFRCTDLDSRHGLFLNGVQVHSCVLRPGDSLQIGSARLIFDEGKS